MERHLLPLDVLPELSHSIIGCAMRVHSALGPGLLESVYEECLCRDLTAAGLSYRRQVMVPISYLGSPVEGALRIDLLVEKKAVVEVKAVDQLVPIHDSQLITYLRLSGLPLGLIINFNVPHLRDGIRRRVLAGRSSTP